MDDHEIRARLAVTPEALAAFCAASRVRELAVFGSIVRDDFGPHSDIDPPATFDPDAPWSHFEIVTMKNEAEAMFGRSVDIFERRAVEKCDNPWKRSLILGSQRRVYTAAQDEKAHSST